MQTTSRFGSIIKNLTRITHHHQQNRIRLSSTATARLRFSSSDESEEEVEERETGSSVYSFRIKTQRPTRIKWQNRLKNCARFIGTVDSPVRVYNTGSGCGGVGRLFGVYTSINVVNTSDLRILVEMWGELAKTSLQHLRPNDLIHVWGQLGCYMKNYDNEEPRLLYKITARKLNYVLQPDLQAENTQAETNRNSDLSRSETHKEKRRCLQLDQDLGETEEERHKNRLHLWQLYFSNPQEWWDNRGNKKYRNSPDFKHKSTGESLWLSPNDPPWIKTQLELIDSRMAGHSEGYPVGSRSCVSQWVYDE